MTKRASLAIIAFGLVAAVVPMAAAGAAPGTGTFTKITTPSKNLIYRYAIGQLNKLRVTGQTSLDVTTVDIDCVLSIVNNPPQIAVLASAVPVTAGQFSVTATFPSNQPTNCRLRAIPAGVDVQGDYIGAYSGPIIYISAFGIRRDGASIPYSYTAQFEEGDGAAVLTDVGSCGVEALVTVQTPQMLAGPVEFTCAFSLLPSNTTASGTSTGSAIQVNGHNAYLPSGVQSLLINTQALAVSQPALTVSHKVASNGDTTVSEAATLMRCSVSDIYPPTAVSCPSLTSTGVRFSRVTTVFRDGHQVKVRDRFTSTDHLAHSLKLQYGSDAQNQAGGDTATGRTGYTYPGHGTAFKPAALGNTITGLGSKLGSMFIRSDLYARSDDPQADTVAETWSRAPSRIQYDGVETDQFGMSYALNVIAGGTASIGFAESERWSTLDTQKLAVVAGRDMLPRLTVTSPHRGAKVRGRTTTVKGLLVAGDNGLPTSVKVNGHKARIHKIDARTASYSVTFTESIGHHTIKATTVDAAGNAVATSIRVTNR